MSTQGISKLFGVESRELLSNIKGWIVNTKIRPAFVFRSAVKWSLVLSLGTMTLSILWERDPAAASLVMGTLMAGYMLYFFVDEIAGAMFEDDPAILRELDK